MSTNQPNHERPLDEAISNWDGYDPYLSVTENLIELQLYMGFLDEANRLIHNVRY